MYPFCGEMDVVEHSWLIYLKIWVRQVSENVAYIILGR